VSSGVIAWFSAGYVAVLWVFLSGRIFIMWRRNVSVLTVAPRRPSLNALGAASFLGTLAVWSALFVYLAFFPSAFVLFRPLWDTSAGVGQVLLFVGVVLAVAGQCFMWVAIMAMGRAWRIGIDDKSPGALITHSVFRLSRNPIFLGFHTAAVAAFLIQPGLFFLLFAVGLIAGIHLQIIGEERHLEKTYGDAYIRYRERTPRYLLFL
jgi:protein-S-isoprenylcysteine O-methyltransferase Ste14